MNWPAAVLIGMLSAIYSIAIAAAVADYAMEAHNVSNFEGARGFGVVFVFMPLGFVTGLLAGTVVGRLWKGRRPGFAGFALRQGVALAVVTGLICGIGGISLLTIDRPPLIDGHALSLEYEVRLPRDAQVPEDLAASELRTSLFASESDNQYADVAFDRVRREDGRLIIPASVQLQSQSPTRMILFGFGFESTQVFDLKLRGVPRREDTAWTDWNTAKRDVKAVEIPEAKRYEIRYRIVIEQ
jgi:MFS family permease